MNGGSHVQRGGFLMRRAIALLTVIALLSVSGKAFASWKNTIVFPDEPYRVQGDTSAMPDWIKFTHAYYDPSLIYFQDSNAYPFHYDFAVNNLPPFAGMSRQDFDQATLYETGRLALLGAVIMPPSGGWPSPPYIPEYGIQFVSTDPLDVAVVISTFNLVKSSIFSDPDVQVYYFPSYDQMETALSYEDDLEAAGIHISSPARWANGNICYSNGWSLGTLKYFESGEIDNAYSSGALQPQNILLTDAVPSEIPFVAGVISLTPSTPNSHVAILAQTFGIPFVHPVLEADLEEISELEGRTIAFTAYDTNGHCDMRTVDLEGVLTDAEIQQILELKNPEPLNIAVMQPYGAYYENTDILTLSDMQFFGGKSANYGFLRRAIPTNAQVAAALSFDVWNEYLDQVMGSSFTLRQEIDNILSAHTFPPDMEQLSDDLDDIRDLFKDTSSTSFSFDLTNAILAALQDPQFGFDPYQKIRFRSSSNMEDSDQFTGAGLYDSYSGCLADDLDGDNTGPSLCDPTEANEKGVFRAIRRVFASFYNYYAFFERLRHGVSESDVGMAILVHHSFPDDIELANGVAAFQRNSSMTALNYMVSQLGAISVTNPSDGSLPEEVEVIKSFANYYPEVLSYSNIVPIGQTVMTWNTDYTAFSALMAEVADDYATAIGKTRFSLDFEYKRTAPVGNLEVKQVRKIPDPDTLADITPFLINDPDEYCTFQGEYGNVFANHRLKARFAIDTRNGWLDSVTLAKTIYDNVAMEYTDGCDVYSVENQLQKYPGAWHTYDSATNTTEDGWLFHQMDVERDYTLTTEYIGNLVSPSQSALQTVADLGMPYWQGKTFEIGVVHSSPVPTWDGMGMTTTTQESVRILPCAEESATDQYQQRSVTGTFTPSGLGTGDASAPKTVDIDIEFYWPQDPGMAAGYTAPLVRWEQTEIEGLTTVPIVLTDWYAQTYRPEHHNFGEHFLFEPRLDPGVPSSTIAELDSLGIQIIHVITNHYGGNQIYFLKDSDCVNSFCYDNGDCLASSSTGISKNTMYCSKAIGDCLGFGTCQVKPKICAIDLYDPVCGCNGVTYNNTCLAAKAGVSIAYPGVCKTTCSTDSDCSKEQFCKTATGACDASFGYCATIPSGCPKNLDPVCGCDGNGYSNECLSDSAAVSVDYSGWCKSEACCETTELSSLSIETDCIC